MNWTLLTLLILTSARAVAITQDDFKAWEKAALEEVAVQKKHFPEKEFLFYMVAARELMAYGFELKAQEYYLKAYKHPSKQDKSEAVIQLITLNREDRAELVKAVARAEDWFNNHPDKSDRQMRGFITMMKGHAQGKTSVQDGIFFEWSRDARVNELMRDGKASQALQTLGTQDLKNADINQKVRQDLLAAVVLGKNASPPLWCRPMLEEYPHSTGWSMRICRYLSDWKASKKSTETVQSIRNQLEQESPARVHWAKLLERL